MPLAAAGDLSAHGIGGAKDLPIPPQLAIAGAVAALVVSFTVLALAWRTPRFNGERDGRPAPAWLAHVVASRLFGWGLRALGLALVSFAVFAAVAGPDSLINPFFGMFYVLLWVGVPAMSVLFGPFYKAISPARTLNALFAKVTGGDPQIGMYAYPRRLGYWPAALGLFAFVWLELVYPFNTELGPVRLWVAVYFVLVLLGSILWGGAFLERGDPFEVFSTLAGKLSVWGSRDGRLVVRTPLRNLDTVAVAPGLVAVVGVLFGSTAFDSFASSSWWLTYAQSSTVPKVWLDNTVLLGFCVIVTVLFAAASVATGVESSAPRWSLPDQFAHSVVPIIVGYIAAHYLTFLVHSGQLTLIQMSDPLARGDNLFGTAGLRVNYWLAYHPTLVSVIKVLGVVVGHVLGVIAAHDRAIRLLPRKHQLTGQLPMLFAMIALTVGGLYLLFAA